MSGNPPSEEGRSRICFVIMPFSESDTCTKTQWDEIFQEVIKPAVEASSYDCRRSTATRGNLIKAIVQDLDASWVVLADLTDQNPNVFYELGVRHALKDRTILIAQNRDDIPFDLQSYANHVYNWQTEDGKNQFFDKIKALLEDVDRDPDRADNPVSDFLESSARGEQPTAVPVQVQLDEFENRFESLEGGLQLLIRHRPASSEPDGVLSALSDASPFDEGVPEVSWYEAGKEMARAKDLPALRQVVRKSIRDIRSKIPPKVLQLNSPSSSGTIQRDQILNEALKFENGFAPLTRNVEELALGLVSVDWVPGARNLLEITGSLISSGKGLSGLRFASGLPAYFGWRLLLICGAHSVQEETFGVTDSLINGPIPIVGNSQQLTYRSLIKHRDLFYPEAMLGYADLAIQQFSSLDERSQYLQDIFGSKEGFLNSLLEFLILIALRDVDVGVDEYPLYPGYRLLPGFQDACGHLISRLVNYPDQLAAVAKILKRSGTELKDSWSILASKANSAELGTEYWTRTSNQIPTTLNSEE